MAKNWAICIGINHYINMPPLKYAQRDAEMMQNYFLNQAGFEKVYLFTDTSPEITDAGQPFKSQPTFGTLRRFFRVRFEKPFMSVGDNFWFFFSGHGVRYAERDYIMPFDADPGEVDATAISLNYVTERLRRCGADNVVLLLDACRDEQSSKGVGIGEEKQKGVITIASCSPRERSYEIEALEQGSFTYALLEALRIQGEGNCATVERLSQRLQYRVAEINRQFWKPRQIPYLIPEPATKYHLILLPKQATENDIAALREDAQEAELDGELELAEQLWIRVLAISPANPKALRALKRIWSQSHPSKSFDSPAITREENAKSSITLPLLSQSADSLHSLSAEPEVQPKCESELEQQLKPETQGEEEVPLRSVRGIGYTQLRDLLVAEKWQEADQETAQVMLKALGKTQNDWLQAEDMNNFPCEDLRTIDRLWVKYSQGRFGFSVQKRIYESLGGTRKYDDKIWEAFGVSVGWREGGTRYRYDDLIFNLTAPVGHLPFCCNLCCNVWGWGGGLGLSRLDLGIDLYLALLAQRLALCKIL